MARLFISLYLFIAVSLVGLSAGLERIFFTQAESSNMQLLGPVFEAALQQNIDMRSFIQSLGGTLEVRSIGDIAWSDNNLQKLHNGQVIVLSDSNVTEQIYIIDNQSQLLEISLPISRPSSGQFLLYSVLFFLLLGGVIAFWIRPLWRDLSSLEKTVSNVKPDGSIEQNTINKSSLIYPIAKSLNNMGRQITQLMQNQRELSGAVTHEFRTPLARLKFALAMNPPAQSNPWLDMQKDVNELENLVQEMLDYASTDARIPEMNLSEIPIKQLCQQLMHRLKETHLAHLNIRVYGDDPHVLADEHFIERAIENLVLNGARFAKKALEIHVIRQKKVIQICIEDDGIGVAKSMRKKIFSPFFRPDESRDRQQGGAGLGLAIVKRIVDWHQGQCYVTEGELGGAKFIISLPNHF
ncbi:ATP-binding protein [uncultured Paraglaciecola sp.]|uniref:ATP-binding protein n=1 Tax=uncultured Paraglaciecola sp. TaxID=1765024 RepID=UPI0030DA05F1|tara:strand:+ start:52573 stop:53802 length:1230 start_codon:yes stop_codon:yes gene_type:complete